MHVKPLWFAKNRVYQFPIKVTKSDVNGKAGCGCSANQFILKFEFKMKLETDFLTVASGELRHLTTLRDKIMKTMEEIKLLVFAVQTMNLNDTESACRQSGKLKFIAIGS